MKKLDKNEKIVFYPGSFDPFTIGHYDVIKRASKIFDKVIVGVLFNINKKYFIDKEDRTNLIKKTVKPLKNVEVVSFNGLLVDYLQKRDIKIVLRGLRAVSDFEYEFQMALMNRGLNSEIETFFMVTSACFSYISSTIIKEILIHNGDISNLVPGPVFNYLSKNRERLLKDRFSNGKKKI